MCGIAGLTLAEGCAPPDKAILEKLAEALQHRGPDGRGSRVVGGTALVQTRLAINDPRGASQPFVDGALSLVANGEIYNHLEILDSLPGARTVSANDCAVGLPLFRAGPDKFPARLRGYVRHGRA